MSTPNPEPRPRRAAALILASVGLVAVLFLAAWGTCGFGRCPDVARLRAYQPGGATLLLDRNGEPFGDLSPVHGSLVSLESLPKHVPAAFIAVEDQRFYKHPGVDLWRIGGAVRRNVQKGSFAEGFSTITMQLARNVFPDEIRMKDRSVWRKLLEMRVALEIERRYTKKDILELYLNHIYFGNGAHGIEAAARHYFRKGAAELSIGQAALLAALIKAPSNYDPRRHPDEARERRNLVLTLMERQKVIDAGEAEEARKAALSIRAAATVRRTDERPAAYFVEEIRRLLEESYGNKVYTHPLRVWTTLDIRMQEAAEAELLKQLNWIEEGRYGRYRGTRYARGREYAAGASRYLQGAVVSIDVATGDVLAWVGGRDHRQAPFDRVSGARRQAGSAFKPFVYAAAFAEGIPLSSFLEDEPLKVQLARGRYWEPKNFSGRYEGRITLRDALVRSVNVATVRLAGDIGWSHIAAVARQAGIRSPIEEVPSMALGTVALSPLELTSAYTAFAGLGTAVTPRLITKIETVDGERLWASETEERRALDTSVAYLVNDVLRDALERGSGAPALHSGFTGPACGKTGTSNDGVDAWFIGYTPEVVTGVWIGFDQPKRIVSGASGGRLAAPVWGRIMSSWYRGSSPPWWQAPSNVVQRDVDPSTGLVLEEGCLPEYGEPAREIFIRGTEPESTCPERRYEDRWWYGWEDSSLHSMEPGISDSAGWNEYLDSGGESAPYGAPDAGRPVVPDEEVIPPEDAAGTSPDPSAAAQDGVDLNGWWDFTNVVEETNYGAYTGLRLGYRIFLVQEGSRVSGEGEKWSEDGSRLPGENRTSITLNGTIRGDRLHLEFTEYGARRTTSGSFDLTLSGGGNQLAGSFRSTAAGSRGSSTGLRVQ